MAELFADGQARPRARTFAGSAGCLPMQHVSWWLVACRCDTVMWWLVVCRCDTCHGCLPHWWVRWRPGPLPTKAGCSRGAKGYSGDEPSVFKSREPCQMLQQQQAAGSRQQQQQQQRHAAATWQAELTRVAGDPEGAEVVPSPEGHDRSQRGEGHSPSYRREFCHFAGAPSPILTGAATEKRSGCGNMAELRRFSGVCRRDGRGAPAEWQPNGRAIADGLLHLLAYSHCRDYP